MRIIFLLLLISFLTKPGFSQQPSKNEMLVQMKEAVTALKKQITDLEKQIIEAKINKEDEETIKGMEDEVAMLKKQVTMMENTYKSMSGISAKTFQQAGEENLMTVPEKDLTRINRLPKKILTDSGLFLFIKMTCSGRKNDSSY